MTHFGVIAAGARRVAMKNTGKLCLNSMTEENVESRAPIPVVNEEREE